MIYVILLLICLLVCLLLRYWFGIKILSSLKKETIYLIILYAILVPMDIWAVKNNVWAFPGDGTLGIGLLGLPIEEYLFILIMPYFFISVHKAVEKIVR